MQSRTAALHISANYSFSKRHIDFTTTLDYLVYVWRTDSEFTYLKESANCDKTESDKRLNRNSSHVKNIVWRIRFAATCHTSKFCIYSQTDVLRMSRLGSTSLFLCIRPIEACVLLSCASIGRGWQVYRNSLTRRLCGVHYLWLCLWWCYDPVAAVCRSKMEVKNALGEFFPGSDL